jgi:predicted extracellular nuclease
MLVRFNQPLVVTGNYSLGQYGQIDLAPYVLYQPTQLVANSTVWTAAADLNSRSLITLDDGSDSSGSGLNGGTVAPYPPQGLSAGNTLRVGARVNPNGDQPPVPLVGILDYRHNAYRIQPVPSGPITFSNIANPRPDTAAVSAAAGARFRIVSTNLLNFFTTLKSRGAYTDTELEHQRAKIVAALVKSSPDLIGLSELQNFENGKTNGGTYTNTAVNDLASALAAATGRHYQFLDTITPSALVAGNTIADNGTDAIRNGIIYDADVMTPVGQAALDNQNDQNRPTLAQTFQPKAGIHPEQQTFTLVVNHFRSRGSACPSDNDVLQGNCNGMRLSMANNVRNWLAGNPTQDPAGACRRYILVGDFNAYLGEDPIQAFLGPGTYTNLIELLVGPEAYSYDYGSQVGYIDYALVNEAALPLVKNAAELHVNADEPPALEALNSNTKSAAAQLAYYAPDEFAFADHDPIVIGFNPLLGDFNDDGVLDAQDRTALLHARGQSGKQILDQRMDMDHDGVITQNDFLIWQKIFIAWQQGRK